MALDKEYFDSIHIDIAKKKYYNAGKVEAVLLDIRREAEAMEAENAALREQLVSLSGEKNAIGDALVSARAVAQQIIRDANTRADDIVREAERKRAAILNRTREQEEHAVSCVRDSIERLKQQQFEIVDRLNEEYQSFLCRLYPEDDPAEQTAEEAELPEDLSEKVGAIAKEMLAMEREE